MLASLTACGGDQTWMDSWESAGRVRFDFAAPPYEPVSTPMLVGTRHAISVYSDYGLPLLKETVEDPSVEGITLHSSAMCCDQYREHTLDCQLPQADGICQASNQRLEYSYYMEVEARGPGKSEVQLRAANGKLYGSVTLQVALPRNVLFRVRNLATQVEAEDKEVIFKAGDKAGVGLRVVALGQGNRPLRGSSSLQLCSTEIKVAAFLDKASKPVRCTSSKVMRVLVPRGPGKAWVETKVAGGTAQLVVKVL